MSTTPIANTATQPDVTFSMDSNGDSLRFRLSTKGGKPIKIGDGTFGSVFMAERRNERYAIKVFYESAIQNDAFRKEMQSADLISDGLTRSARGAFRSRLVLPIASTEAFTGPALDFIKATYPDLSLSTAALAMPLYEISLKDWLEKGHATAKGFSEPLYKVLTRVEMASASREYFALWITKQVAEGVLALHAAGYHHHDIKPANILLRSDGNSLDAALADLGFLEIAEASAGTMSATLHGAPSGGTRHYRSLEQRDFFDICDVEVRVDTEKNQGHLIVQDPKFEDSLTEIGDFVVFSKRKYHRYPIIDIKKPARLTARQSNGGGEGAEQKKTESAEKIAIAHAHTILILGLAKETSLTDDPRTQIVIQKRHTVRTDLFGLGALLYDIVTGGRSPERFYDRIRHWDRDGKKVIDSLMNNYRQRLDGYESISPEFNYIFELLKPSARQNYPSESLVRLILSLMLSRASDSYFGEGPQNSDNTGKDAAKVIERVIGALDRAIKIKKSAAAQNLQDKLWSDDSTEGPTDESSINSDLLHSIRQIQSCSDAKVRLFHGGFYLYYHLARFLSKLAQNQKPYYTVLSPSLNLSYKEPIDKSNFRPGRDLYTNREDFLSALALETLPILPSSQDVFLPDYVNSLSRKAKVKLPFDEQQIETIARQKERAPLNALINLEFENNHPLKPAPGDLVVCRFDDIPPRLVLELQKVTPQGTWECIERSPANEQAFHSLTEGVQNALLIRPIKPDEYYLAAAGMFLHQIFYVDSRKEPGFVPPAYDFVEQTIASGYFDEVSAQEWFERIKKPHERAPGRLAQLISTHNSHQRALVSLIYECLADFYLLLTTRFLRSSVCKNQDRIAMVQQYLDDLGELIVQIEPGFFQNRQQLVSKDPDWSKLLLATDKTLPSLEKNLREKSLKEIKVQLRG